MKYKNTNLFLSNWKYEWKNKRRFEGSLNTDEDTQIQSCVRGGSYFGLCLIFYNRDFEPRFRVLIMTKFYIFNNIFWCASFGYRYFPIFFYLMT